MKGYCDYCKSMQETSGQSHGAWLDGEGLRCLNCNKDKIRGIIPADFADDETPVDIQWLDAMGFKIDITPAERFEATIVVDDYGGTSAKARIDLRLLFIPPDDEWVTDIFSYNESGEEENCVGLTGSWCKTRADVVRLGLALIERWREC